MNVTLPEADCAAIQRGRHYWPTGSSRPMTLAQMLEVKMSCGTATRYLELQDGSGNLYDRQIGRNVLVRESTVEKPPKVKTPKPPGVRTLRGVLLRQAMTLQATEGVVHAHKAD